MPRERGSSPKPGWVYVVTNECLKTVKAKGGFRGRIKAVKIGKARDFTDRLGTLNISVYENFDLHLGLKTDDVAALEGAIQDIFQDYRIYTQEGNRTEFFACPVDEVVRRIKQHSRRGFAARAETMMEYKGGKRLGRSSANIRTNIRRDVTARGRTAARSAQRQTARAKPFSFSRCPSPVGRSLSLFRRV